MGEDFKKQDGGAPGAQARIRSRREDEGPVIGTLIAHGRDHFLGKKDQGLSYYVKIRTMSGKFRTFWGKDLDRAIHAGQTRPKVGDRVGVHRIVREPITFAEKVRDGHGRVIGELPRKAFRSRWQVETPKFFADNARQARSARDTQFEIRNILRERPELKSTFLSRRAVELLAQQRIADPAERQRLIQFIAEAMTASIQRGEPLPEIKLRDRKEPVKQKIPARDRDREGPAR